MLRFGFSDQTLAIFGMGTEHQATSELVLHLQTPEVWSYGSHLGSRCLHRAEKSLKSISLTFADVFVFQPESALDLLVWVPDGAGLLEAVDRFLDVMIAKLVQQGHEIHTRCGPVQGVESIAEG